MEKGEGSNGLGVVCQRERIWLLEGTKLILWRVAL